VHVSSAESSEERPLHVSERYPIAVLVSGTGTNLQAIIDTLHVPADSPVQIVLVVTSSAEAAAKNRAEAVGIPVTVVDRDDYDTREDRDRALADVVEGADPKLVVLAGWMSILTPWFLDRFPDRVINLHPSMLPAFPGMHAIEEAHAWGVRYTGVTVHFADPEVDGGPPVLQEPVPVHFDDTVDDLRLRIRMVEHRLLTTAIGLFAAGKITRDPARRRKVKIDDDGSDQ
jgi:phosphoribosylglycinamide formyltransferase-1